MGCSARAEPESARADAAAAATSSQAPARASVAPSAPSAAAAAAVATDGGASTLKSSGSFHGIAWKPLSATVSVRGDEAMLLLQDYVVPLDCRTSPGDIELQLAVFAPYKAGADTDVAKLRQPKPRSKDQDEHMGKVSLQDVSTGDLAAGYTGTVRFLTTPTRVGTTARVRVDVVAGSTRTSGEIDARVCFFQ